MLLLLRLKSKESFFMKKEAENCDEYSEADLTTALTLKFLNYFFLTNDIILIVNFSLKI